MPNTLVAFLLDRTGSMASVRDDTIGAFNAYVDELKKGKNILFSFVQFDSQSIDKIHVRTPVATVAKLTRETYVPRAATPLIDAAYKTIKAVEEALNKDKKSKVVICIQTDGQENASTEHTWNELNVLIKEKTASGWQFNFMGVGIDAYDQGAKMGIARHSTVAYNHQDGAATRDCFVANASNTVGYSAGTQASTAYTTEQKRLAGDTIDTPDVKTPAKKPAKKPTLVEDFNL